MSTRTSHSTLPIYSYNSSVSSMQSPSSVTATPINPEYLDTVIETLGQYSHPFVLLGWAAKKWMGLEVESESTVSILIRKLSFPRIHLSLEETGEWDLAPHAPEHGILLDHFTNTFSLHLIDEESARLKVDDAVNRVQVPGIFALRSILVEKEFADGGIEVAKQKELPIEKPVEERFSRYGYGRGLRSSPPAPKPKVDPGKVEWADRYISEEEESLLKELNANIYIPSIPAQLDSILSHLALNPPTHTARALESEVQLIADGLNLHLPAQMAKLRRRMSRYDDLEEFLDLLDEIEEEEEKGWQRVQEWSRGGKGIKNQVEEGLKEGRHLLLLREWCKSGFS